jgi:hypothetical protein
MSNALNHEFEKMSNESICLAIRALDNAASADGLAVSNCNVDSREDGDDDI